MAYTWTELLDDIKVRGAIPTSQSTFTAARLLNLANAVMRSKIVPIVDKARQAYYSYDYDWTIVDGYSVLIPSRAVAGKLIDVALLNSTERQDAVLYQEQELLDYTVAPSLPGFYVKRNRVFPVPSDGGGWGVMRLTYLMRPNTIVDNDDAAQITAINTGTKTATFAACPSTWTTGNIFDLVQGTPHFDWFAIDQVITAVTATTMTFSSSFPQDLAVGDWISLAGETPVIQCPLELHPLLAQEVANVCHKAQGDERAFKLGEMEAKMMREDVSAAISSRVEYQGKKINNRTGVLRRGL